MSTKRATIDITVCPDFWIKFTDSIWSQRKTMPTNRYYIDTELKKYKAIFMTDGTSYAKLVFEDEKYKTLFLLKWS